MNDLRVTTEDEGITIHYSYKVLKQSPEVKHIDWCKNGEPLDRKSEKYIGGSLNENSLTITSPTDEDRGEYSCTITNAVGSISKVVIFGNFIIYYRGDLLLFAQIRAIFILPSSINMLLLSIYLHA